MKVTWIDGHREPACAPNPVYPAGIDLNGPGEGPRCRTDLPYPARRIGWYSVECETCGQTIMVTTAGRADDPRSLTMACRPKPELVQ